MKRFFFVLITTFTLAISGCNMLIRLPIGGPDLIPIETFLIDEAIPSKAIITYATLTLAPSNGLVVLAASADKLASGEIQYNVADWKPTVLIDGNTLQIKQDIPDNNISSTPKDSINEWALTLGNTLTNVTVSLATGNYTLTFTDTLPDSVTIHVSAGVGNLRLEFPTGVTANVEVQRGPANIETEGDWSKTGNSYTSGNAGSVWNIKVDIGVGNLTLVSQ